MRGPPSLSLEALLLSIWAATYATHVACASIYTPGQTCFDSVIVKTKFDDTDFKPCPLRFGALPRVAHRWEANFSQADFKTMFDTHTKRTWMVAYKIVDGVLWRTVHDDAFDYAKGGFDSDATEELIFMAMWLFELPDMEFAVFYGVQYPGSPYAPVMARAIDVRRPDGGYAIPYGRAWYHAMSRSQLQQYATCMQEAFPLDTKV